MSRIFGESSKDKVSIIAANFFGIPEALASWVRQGYMCRRGQQYSGANGDADVVGLPGIHIECKRVERLNIYDAISQAVHDAKTGILPAVFHRKDRCEWLVTMRLPDWMEIYREWESGRNER